MSAAVETPTLPADNAAQLAIYDTLYEEGIRGGGTVAIMNEEDLFTRVITRLRILVPRELHLCGERAYFEQKLEVCTEAGIVTLGIGSQGKRTVTVGARLPKVLYPGGEIRDYAPGLEAARERLDSDNGQLRAAGFDIREAIPSLADDPEGPGFQRLLASMRDHGFLRHFPVQRHDGELVLDGRARILAAATLGLEVEYLKEGSVHEQMRARRRDTPLERITVTLDANAARLPGKVLDDVHRRLASITGRPWGRIEADLALTRDWRHSLPAEHGITFEVQMVAYRDQEEARVQVTADRKVMLRSLVRASGLDSYKTNVLDGHVAVERARTRYSGGRRAIFVRVEDLIPGIAEMIDEKRVSGRKIDPEWDQIRDWLVETFEPART